MFSRILVPVDGSEWSSQALAWAERLAADAAAEVLLLEVVPRLGGLFAALPTPTLLSAAAREQELETAQATVTLSNMVHALHGKGLRASRYVEVGHAALKIIEFVEHHGIDLVVMGTHGRGGVSRALLGSVADEVRRRAEVPVLLAPHPAAPPVGEASVLICLDQSLEAESALDAGTTLAAALGARLELFEAVEDRHDSLVASAYLETKAQALRASGLPVMVVTARGDPGPSILLQADIMASSVIAIASHGRSGVARAALGSVASHVVAHSRVPVLIAQRGAVAQHPGPSSTVTSPTRSV